MSVFVDTNVLLYAVGIGASEAKRNRARTILADGDRVLSAQVINEFMHQSTRSSRPDRMTFDEARVYVLSLRRFRIVPVDLELIEAAMQLYERARYSWWDSLIVAAAITAGCDALYSDDMQHGRVIDGVRIENPFRELA